MDQETSELPLKKVRLEQSMDPLKKLCSDVFELIFQHFTSADVLESSKITHCWFEATAKSQKCVEKLHLKVMVPFDKKEAEKFNTISQDLASSRNYQNIYLHNFQEIVHEIVKLMTGRKWKKVFISVRNLRSMKDLLDIMKIIEPTVENLSISGTSVRDPYFGPEVVHLSFPALKYFELTRSFGLLMREISRDCKNLKQLKIDTDMSSWIANEKYLRKILIHNEQLEKLTLWRCSAIHPFNEESIKHYRFKLKTFVYKNTSNLQKIITGEEEECLHDFLESQADSLETLRIDEWCGSEVLRLIFKMSKLSQLTLDFDAAEKTIDWENLKLNPNFSIKKFHIESISKVSICNALFNALPNLRVLTIERLNNNTLNSIGSRCQVLEELEIQDLRASHVDDPLYFPSIKKFHCEDRIRMKLKRRINHKPVNERSPFEQLVLTAEPYHVTQ